MMDANEILTIAGRLAAAFLLAVPVGWEREKSTRIMGLRTFPLVALASCGYVLVALGVTDPEDAEARARILQGLMAGIGFIGGGAILKQESGVKGTATAASVWSTGAIGAAVGFDQWAVAILVSAGNFLTLKFLTPVEEALGKADPSDEPRDDRKDAGS